MNQEPNGCGEGHVFSVILLSWIPVPPTRERVREVSCPPSRCLPLAWWSRRRATCPQRTRQNRQQDAGHGANATMMSAGRGGERDSNVCRTPGPIPKRARQTRQLDAGNLLTQPQARQDRQQGAAASATETSAGRHVFENRERDRLVSRTRGRTRQTRQQDARDPQPQRDRPSAGAEARARQYRQLDVHGNATVSSAGPGGSPGVRSRFS